MSTNCCLYRLIIDKNIPFIDMKKFSYYKDEDDEKELLLPRNLIITLINESKKIITFGVKKEYTIYNAYITMKK